MTLPKLEVVDIVRKAGVASGNVATIPEVLEDPQLKHRGMITDLYHPELGKVKGAKGHDFPLKFSESKGGFERPASYLGAHNEEVLCDILGYTKEELFKFKEDGVIS
jgi:crotonobetainyl-CoA:carnitine CoA-transferase CaiB-like acyl-CoA transferase